MTRKNLLSVSRLLALAFATASIFGQGSTLYLGFPTDWSSRHVIFSPPATLQDALRIRQDPRYWHQLLRRASRGVPAPVANAFLPIPVDPFNQNKNTKNNKLKADWSQSLGSSSAKVGADNYPAKYSFSTATPTAANCAGGAAPDFVVYNTGVAGGSGQASIIAYDNLYATTCSGTVPQTYWAYNTGGTISTSVVLSMDGSQVAFIHSASTASLVLLKWKAGSGATVTSPVSSPTLANVANSAYKTCTAPCMTTISFGSNNDTMSSPFYDYTGDVIYVGDAGGNLHKFTNVFLGSTTPAAAGSPWPVVGGNGSAHLLTSPVFDAGSQLVYVANYTSDLAEVTPSGTVTHSGGIVGATNDIQEGPVVDSSAQRVYVFVEGGTNNYIDQFATSFASGAPPLATVNVGSGGSSSQILFTGTFDNAYYATAGTGNLYVCGDTAGHPTLYQIPITSGTMSTTANTGPALASANTQCSPVSEVYNNVLSGGPYDWIYMGVNASGSPSGCGGSACVIGVTVTSWLKGTAYSLGQMVVDNHFNIEVVTTAGTSGASITWPGSTPAGTSTTDNTVHWTSQGPFAFTTFATGHSYALNAVIVDTNNNLERVTTAGTSGGSTPSWNASFGGTTTSGGATFTNQGVFRIIGSPYAGGTSGIVIDNISTATGASNIYFSTLGSDSSCSSHGCAIQASQITP